jgi:hypothetical protein
MDQDSIDPANKIPFVLTVDRHRPFLPSFSFWALPWLLTRL